jgi:hypothetical protein
VANFKTMLEGFSGLAMRLTGLTPASVVHAHMPPKVVDPHIKGRLEFRVISCRSVNTNADELRETYDVALNQLRITSLGIRYLTIQVKFIGYDHRSTQDALFYLERLGDRIHWPPSLAELRAIDMGLINRGTFLDLSKVISAEDRQGSVGVKDFMFIAAVSEEISDPDGSPLSWIETVQFTSDTLDGEDGNPLGRQISGTVTRP